MLSKFEAVNSYNKVIYFRTDITFNLEVYTTLGTTYRDRNNDTTLITMKPRQLLFDRAVQTAEIVCLFPLAI